MITCNHCWFRQARFFQRHAVFLVYNLTDHFCRFGWGSIFFFLNFRGQNKSIIIVFTKYSLLFYLKWCICRLHFGQWCMRTKIRSSKKMSQVCSCQKWLIWKSNPPKLLFPWICVNVDLCIAPQGQTGGEGVTTQPATDGVWEGESLFLFVCLFFL